MGCIFIPLAGDFFSIKKMSDYYGEYLFSSPTGAFLISKYQKLSEEFMFSSPPGAYLISIITSAMVFGDDSKFSSPTGAYLISMSAHDVFKRALDESFRPLPGHI